MSAIDDDPAVLDPLAQLVGGRRVEVGDEQLDVGVGVADHERRRAARTRRRRETTTARSTGPRSNTSATSRCVGSTSRTTSASSASSAAAHLVGEVALAEQQDRARGHGGEPTRSSGGGELLHRRLAETDRAEPRRAAGRATRRRSSQPPARAPPVTRPRANRNRLPAAARHRNLPRPDAQPARGDGSRGHGRVPIVPSVPGGGLLPRLGRRGRYPVGTARRLDACDACHCGLSLALPFATSKNAASLRFRSLGAWTRMASTAARGVRGSSVIARPVCRAPPPLRGRLHPCPA